MNATPAQKRFMEDVARNDGRPTLPVSPTVIRNCYAAGFTTVDRLGRTHLTVTGRRALEGNRNR